MIKSLLDAHSLRWIDNQTLFDEVNYLFTQMTPVTFLKRNWTLPILVVIHHSRSVGRRNPVNDNTHRPHISFCGDISWMRDAVYLRTKILQTTAQLFHS